jgi:hypothetical protein
MALSDAQGKFAVPVGQAANDGLMQSIACSIAAAS